MATLDGPISLTEHLAIVDVSDELPRRPRKRYKLRGLGDITHAIVHHTAGHIAEPPAGLLMTAEFFAGSRSDGGREWPGFGYHVYIPYRPHVVTAEGVGRYVIYQTQPWDVVSYHTKGMNDRAVGVVFQGHFTKRTHPSLAQQQIASWLHGEVLFPELGIDIRNVHTHSMHGKPACPGPWLENFFQTLNGSIRPDD